MTRKDYILIAGALADWHSVLAGKHESAAVEAALRVANALESDNPRFNREHFLAVVRGERELQSRPPRNGGR